MAYIGNKPPVVSNLITDIKIAEDDETKIDFADANTINFHANNSKEMVLVENALTPGTSDGIALGTTSLMWSDLFLASGAVMNFDDGDVTLTHSANTLTVAGGTLATAALTSSTITASGIIKTDDATNATSTTDGSLQTDGGLSVVLDAVFGDDVFLLSDSAVLNMGADNDVTLTHDGTTGVTIAANPITLDSGADIVLDADGADIVFKDAGTTYGSATNSSGNLIIKSGTTTALTFDGANVTSSGNVTLADDKTVTLGEAGKVDFGDSDPDDNEATGIIISFTAQETLAIGDVVYMHTDGKVKKADMNAASTMPAIGICTSAASADAAVDVMVQGVMHDSSAFPTFGTVGADVFVSSSGDITATAPSGSGDTVQKIGVAIHADKVYFNFNTTEVLLA